VPVPYGSRSAAAPHAGASAPPEVPFQHSIRFEDVGFAYAPGRDVLSHVWFEIPRGHKVAVVGPSGGGKTTLANLLLHYYEPTTGRITVDGVDLREYPRNAWRRKIGLVLQGVHLYPGTLRENLTVFDPARSDAEIRRALDIVQALSLAERLEGGLDAPLAERGANLSLGERQLLSFARALVHDPPILVLDEATASVDPITERRIQRGIERMLAGRTAFIIAHRLSTITRAERILVVVDGRVVESGKHDELYALGGHYKRLFDLQFHDGNAGAPTPPAADAQAPAPDGEASAARSADGALPLTAGGRQGESP
jgi:ATP-binding cassette subfamily B protein